MGKKGLALFDGEYEELEMRTDWQHQNPNSRAVAIFLHFVANRNLSQDLLKVLHEGFLPLDRAPGLFSAAFCPDAWILSEDRMGDGGTFPHIQSAKFNDIKKKLFPRPTLTTEKRWNVHYHPSQSSEEEGGKQLRTPVKSKKIKGCRSD